MRNVTFDFLGQYRHGDAFRQYLRLRKHFFVDQMRWDVPHDCEVEMDQYDNPCAQYSLVIRDKVVIGGARAMPTTACWGQYSYMLRDALRGEIEIPAEAIPEEISDRRVWECTRLVVSESLNSHAERSACLALIVGGLIEVANAEGGIELISLSPLPLVKTLRRLGYPASRIGEPYLSSDGRRYAVLRMPALAPATMIAAE